MAKHVHITQNNKFAISLQHLEKEVSDAVDFLHVDKHESLLQFDTMTLMEMVKYSQSSQNSKLAMSSGFIQHRLNYILILNTLQEFVTMTEILTPASTDHSLVLFSLSKEKTTIRGNTFWKYNSSLIKVQNYIAKIKKLIHNFFNENESLSTAN